MGKPSYSDFERHQHSFNPPNWGSLLSPAFFLFVFFRTGPHFGWEVSSIDSL